MNKEALARQIRLAGGGAMLLAVDMFARPAFLAPQLTAHALVRPGSPATVEGWFIVNWRRKPKNQGSTST